MIISRSYFTGIIKIPNVLDTAPNSNLLGNGNEIDIFIEEFEREILIKCLGYSLFTLFSTQLDSKSMNGLKQGSDQKWDYLLNGKEYDLNGQTVLWRGLKFKDGLLERSLIAYYVFCEFLNNDLQNYSGVGVQKERAKNSIVVSADPLYTSAFRKFYELTEFSNDCNKDVRSLYDFIKDSNDISNDTYANWKPERFKNVNVFGI
jgi:hypothetical protein